MVHGRFSSKQGQTDRKFKPHSTSTEYTLNPLLSTTSLCKLQPPIYFKSKTTFVWCSQRFDTRNRRQLHTACNPDLADHTTHCTTPAPVPHQSHSAACASSTAQDYYPNVWPYSSSRIGSASTPALCNNRS